MHPLPLRSRHPLTVPATTPTQTWNSSNVPVVRPPQFDVDYGSPLDANCLPTSDAIVFTRRYSHATVSLNCSGYTATFA